MELGTQAAPAAPAPEPSLTNLAATVAAAAPAPDPSVQPAAQAADAPQNPENGNAAAPADPRAEITALSQEYGIDLSGCPDVASAKWHIRRMTERSLHEGIDELQQLMGGQQYQQPQPGQWAQPPYDPRYQTPPPGFGYQPQIPLAQPTPPQFHPGGAAPAPHGPQPIDLKAVGLDEGDPAAKALRLVEAQLQQSLQASQAVAQQFQQFQYEQREAARAQRNAEAYAFIDTFKSPVYGVTGYRNWAQQAAADQLLQAANAVMLSSARNGQRIPTIRQMISRAKMHLEADVAVIGQQQGQPPNAPALRQTSPAPVPPAPVGLHQQWSQNSQMRQAAGITSDY